MASTPDSGMDADVLSATLADGLRESQDLLNFLALKFEEPLAELVVVRRRGGLFGNKHQIEEITFRFDEAHLQITREGHGAFTPKHLKVVRGVVLKTSMVEIESWLRTLSELLARQAERSSAFRDALSKFILE